MMVWLFAMSLASQSPGRRSEEQSTARSTGFLGQTNTYGCKLRYRDWTKKRGKGLTCLGKSQVAPFLRQVGALL